MHDLQPHEAAPTVNLASWVPVVLWAGVLFLMSTDTFSYDRTYVLVEPILRFIVPSISSKQVELVHAIIRKMSHVAEYFIFGLLLYRALKNSARESRLWRIAFWSLVVVTLLAAADEMHQSFVVSRSASVRDVAFDVFGGVLAMGFGAWWFGRQGRRRLESNETQA